MIIVIMHQLQQHGSSSNNDAATDAIHSAYIILQSDSASVESHLLTPSYTFDDEEIGLWTNRSRSISVGVRGSEFVVRLDLDLDEN